MWMGSFMWMGSLIRLLWRFKFDFFGAKEPTIRWYHWYEHLPNSQPAIELHRNFGTADARLVRLHEPPAQIFLLPWASYTRQLLHAVNVYRLLANVVPPTHKCFYRESPWIWFVTDTMASSCHVVLQFSWIALHHLISYKCLFVFRFLNASFDSTHVLTSCFKL